MRELTGEVVRERAAFVRAEAARVGRDPQAITISTSIFSVSLAQSTADAEASARTIGEMIGVTPRDAVRSPLFLIGTPDQCVEELRRRVREWGVGQFTFMAETLETMRRLAKEILPHVKVSL